MPFVRDQASLLITFSGVLLILSLATAGFLALRQWRPQPNLAKVGDRIRLTWTLAFVFLLAIFFGPTILILYIAFLSFLALKEFLSITPTRRSDRRVLFFAYLAISLQFFLVWLRWYQLFVIFIPIWIFLVLPTLMVWTGDTAGFLRAVATLGWGIMTTVFSLGYLAYLLVLPPPDHPAVEGIGLFLFLVVITQLSDISQFLLGKLFNQPWLRLKVTTTRTWASLLGGVPATALISWLAGPLLTPLSGLEAIGVGAVIAVGGFVGYITTAAIKSDLKLKDRGTMTPGQGGVLNRIDTLMYSAPLFFYLVLYLHYGL